MSNSNVNLASEQVLAVSSYNTQVKRSNQNFSPSQYRVTEQMDENTKENDSPMIRESAYEGYNSPEFFNSMKFTSKYKNMPVFNDLEYSTQIMQSNRNSVERVVSPMSEMRLVD